MFAELPYEIFDIILDYLSDKNKCNLYKSYNKEIYNKAIKFNKKNMLYDYYSPYTFINSKLFIAKNIFIVLPEDVKDLTNFVFRKITNINLKFCDIFNENIDLLSNLDIDIGEIQLGKHFNKNINILPKTLKKIKFGLIYKKNLDNLPDNLTHLSITRTTGTICKFPKTITHLNICSKSLVNNEINKIYFPNLTHLNLSCGSETNIDNLPETLKHLVIHYRSHSPFPDTKLPDSIKYLILKNCNNTIIKYPKNLKYLSVDKLPSDVDLSTLANLKHLCVNSRNFTEIPKNTQKLTLKFPLLLPSSDMMSRKFVIPEGITDLYLETHDLVQNIVFSNTVKYVHILKAYYSNLIRVFKRILPENIIILPYEKKRYF